MAKELEIVISQLLHGINVVESNQYLLEFVEKDVAWEASLELFNAADPDVRYFASNIVYSKIKKIAQWNQLSELQRNEIFDILIAHLNLATQTVGAGGNIYTNFLDRLILCFAVVCSRAVGGISLYIKAALDRANHINFLSIIGLKMLCALPTEVEALEVESKHLDLQTALLLQGVHVLSKINEIAVSMTWKQDINIHTLSMKVLRCWLLPLGLTLSRLAEDFEPVLLMVCTALQSGDGVCVTEGCSVLREVTEVADYPRSEVRDRAVLAILHHITSNACLLVPYFQVENGGNEQVAFGICNTLVALASSEVGLVASPRYCSADFFQLLLFCSRQRPRKIASLTFDVWIALADIPIAERHPYVAHEVFHAIVHNTLINCAYPADYSSTWDESADDEDDLAEYRDNKCGIQEVILVAIGALETSFFDILEEKLFESTVITNRAVVVRDWRSFEAVLFVLQCAMETVKSFVQSADKSLKSRNFLARVTELMLSEDAQKQCLTHREMRCTACTLLGSLTFLLTENAPLQLGRPGENAEKSQFSHFFVPSLTFLFQSLSVLSCCDFAAKAINQLCTHGRKLLATPQSSAPEDMLVFGAVEATIRAIHDSLLLFSSRDHVNKMLDAILIVIEGVMRSVLTLPTQIAASCLLSFAVFIEKRIEEEFCGSFSDMKVEIMLKYAAQIVRFSDAPVDNNGAHVLTPFLHRIYPLLERLADPTVCTNSDIMVAILDVQGRALMSASALVLSEVPKFTQIIVGVLRRRGEASSAALQCATIIVEVLASKGNEEIALFLSNLLDCIVQVLVNAAAEQQYIDKSKIFGYEPDCMEKFFRFVYAYLISSPHILADSPALAGLSHICAACFASCSENNPLRSLLQVVQTLYYPNFKRISVTVHAKLIAASVVNGQAMIFRIMSIIAGIAPGISPDIFPNILETLFSILSGCQPEYTDVCKMWIFNALNEIKTFAKINDQQKQFVFEKMFQLAGDNRGKFKALCSDLSKICSGEVSVECLSSYL